ncbi:endodeoxyribonuclease-like protein [Coniochaeta sp. 2T2.1]|nr:endodeoxyribonuclease-like protein [Coniochaeta sp. 2T2.1]
MATTTSTTTTPSGPSGDGYQPRYIDIGINLADPIFRGRYHGTQRHPDDLKGVIQRAKEVGCTKLIVTGSSFKSSRDALKLAEEFPGTVYTTAGIHPCSSSIFSVSHKRHHEHDEDHSADEHTPACGPDPDKPVPDGLSVSEEKTKQIIADLESLVKSAPPTSLIALGEFGLDYDRLHYCPADVQLHSFAAQLKLAAELKPQLPLFLHSRAAHADFVRLLKDAFGPRLEKLEKGGVVHSFTGTVEEVRELSELGLYIGINGCSFKTAENCAVVKEIDLDRLMIETDGPWCEVRPSHEGWKYLLPPKPAESVETNGVDSGSGTATPVGGTETPAKGGRKQGKKNQKKEPEVSERFKVVKKEKWEEGAMVKGRNESCTIERVAKIVAGIKGISVEEVCETAWANTVKVFGLDA